MIPKIIYENNNYNYSTDEQAIGTWIDGKKLYKKTITFSGKYQTDLIVNHNIKDVDTIFIGKESYANGGDKNHNYTIPFYNKNILATDGLGTCRMCYAQASSTQIAAFIGTYLCNADPTFYITLYYTKTV